MVMKIGHMQGLNGSGTDNEVTYIGVEEGKTYNLTIINSGDRGWGTVNIYYSQTINSQTPE